MKFERRVRSLRRPRKNRPGCCVLTPRTCRGSQPAAIEGLSIQSKRRLKPVAHTIEIIPASAKSSVLSSLRTRSSPRLGRASDESHCSCSSRQSALTRAAHDVSIRFILIRASHQLTNVTRVCRWGMRTEEVNFWVTPLLGSSFQPCGFGS
jgi:hypothetical protein